MNNTLKRRYLTKLVLTTYSIIFGVSSFFAFLGNISMDGFIETLRMFLNFKLIFFLIIQILSQILYCYIIAPISFTLVSKYSFAFVGILLFLSSNVLFFLVMSLFYSFDFKIILAFIVPNILSGAIIGRLIKDKIQQY
jgi:hypothetical protein